MQRMESISGLMVPPPPPPPATEMPLPPPPPRFDSTIVLDSDDEEEFVRRNPFGKEKSMATASIPPPPPFPEESLPGPQPRVELMEFPEEVLASLEEGYQGPSKPGLLSAVAKRVMLNLQRESHAKSSWIVGCIFLERDPGFSRVRAVLTERLLAMPRFRATMIVKEDKAFFRELAPDLINIDYHIRQVVSNRAMSREEVEGYLGTLFDGSDTPNAEKRPLWNVRYIPKMDDGRACLITSVSHAIGDMISQAELLRLLLDQAPQAEPFGIVKEPKRLGRVTRNRYWMRGVKNGLLGKTGEADPFNTLRQRDRPGASPIKRVRFTENISLDRVHEIREKMPGVTVDDILVTVLTLMFKAYFVESRDRAVLGGARVRMTFPVSLRTHGEHELLDNGSHNAWARGTLPLFLHHTGSSVSLLWKIKKRYERAKTAPSLLMEPRVTQTLSSLLSSKSLNRHILRTAAKSTIQMCGVTGPSQDAHLAGATVDDVHFLQFSPASLVVGLVSSNNKARASISVAADLGVRPEAIATHWTSAFDQLHEEIMGVPRDSIRPPRGCFGCF
ncbi:Putative diacyglycerol O-acyltransferase Rv1425 (Putative triacylglycerol synthase Rv1425) [Durusdinium trenchii]|uniref:Diacyglycerol O-acyltransferase Rv1425 (Putative triacylglycerol synthase Rv1425) n=1 Tax=Durusdinium trenchii TaxID=1381693 RepID=A0ABP0J5S8_9DINO